MELMGRLGFEPRTNRLKAEYSTVELATLGCCLYLLCWGTPQALLPCAMPVRDVALQSRQELLVGKFSFITIAQFPRFL